MHIARTASLTFRCHWPQSTGHRFVRHWSAVSTMFWTRSGEHHEHFLTQPLTSALIFSSLLPSAMMSSVLDKIIANDSNSWSTPLTPPMQNIPPTLNNNNDSLSDSNSERSRNTPEDQVTQTQVSTLDSQNTVAAFTINVVRNLQLTINREKSLMEFSQVITPSSFLSAMLIKHLELDARSALIYQQATLIKMSETHSRLEHAAAQGHRPATN